MTTRLAPGLALGLAAALVAAGAVAQPPALEPTEARPQLQVVERQLERWQSEQARVAAELEALGAERGRAQVRLRERARLLYRLHRRTGMPGAGGLASRLRHRAHLERLGRMVTGDLTALDELRRRGTALREQTARLAREIEAGQARLEELRRVAEEQERQAEAAALWGSVFETSSFDAPAAVPGLRVLDEPAGASFSRLRGRLPIPVAGSVTVRDAEREGGDGVELDAPYGAAVRAVAAARVAYAAPHPSFGPLVVLDHGGGFYSVYGGLGRLQVQTGQSVPRDGVLADVDRTPVFFQVRQGTRPLSARRWLGL